MTGPNEKPPFGAFFRYIGAKVGGVNRPGPHGGVYDHNDGKRSLFKQDTHKGKVRTAKVIGEAVGGKILAARRSILLKLM